MNKILKKELKKLNDKNLKLFDKKTELEYKILQIDIDIFDLMDKYVEIIEELCSQYEVQS